MQPAADGIDEVREGPSLPLLRPDHEIVFHVLLPRSGPLTLQERSLPRTG